MILAADDFSSLRAFSTLRSFFNATWGLQQCCSIGGTRGSGLVGGWWGVFGECKELEGEVAITVGVLVEIVLMVFFSVVEVCER